MKKYPGKDLLCMKTKTIYYKCGCKVVLSIYGKQRANIACQKHFEGIKRIVTEEIYE
jgi:hypothetical protein